jgi:hypothetical protein
VEVEKALGVIGRAAAKAESKVAEEEDKLLEAAGGHLVVGAGNFGGVISKGVPDTVSSEDPSSV